MTGPWLTFKLQDRRDGRKTDIYEVWTIAEDQRIGMVAWYTPWRKYCFAPTEGTVWDPYCLREIADFVEILTQKHKEAKT